MQKRDLFSAIPDSSGEEIFETLLHTESFKLERIISSGQATPPGEWLQSDQHEWVILLKGAAGVRFEGREETIDLDPGDFIHIPAQQRHRVEWTDENETVWLALHYLPKVFMRYPPARHERSCAAAMA